MSDAVLNAARLLPILAFGFSAWPLYMICVYLGPLGITVAVTSIVLMLCQFSQCSLATFTLPLAFASIFIAGCNFYYATLFLGYKRYLMLVSALLWSIVVILDFKFYNIKNNEESNADGDDNKDAAAENV